MGVSLANYHDSILLWEWRCVTVIGPLVKLDAPGEGPLGHETSHHVVVLELVLDGVCVVWVGLLKKPLEPVYRRPRQAHVATHGS
jgi:hypothetical protein